MRHKLTAMLSGDFEAWCQADALPGVESLGGPDMITEDDDSEDVWTEMFAVEADSREEAIKILTRVLEADGGRASLLPSYDRRARGGVIS